MTYAEIALALGIEAVCSGGCGLNGYRHRGALFLGVLHWRERRVTRRGLRKFLLLEARRRREADPAFLNDRRFAYLYLYLDEMAANEMAGRLHVRFPVEFSRAERQRCRWLAYKAGARLSLRPAAYAWACGDLA